MRERRAAARPKPPKEPQRSTPLSDSPMDVAALQKRIAVLEAENAISATESQH